MALQPYNATPAGYTPRICNGGLLAITWNENEGSQIIAVTAWRRQTFFLVLEQADDGSDKKEDAMGTALTAASRG